MSESSIRKTSNHDQRPSAIGPTIPEAATEYGLPVRYVKRLVDERRITVYKLDRVRIDRASLEAFIENARRDAQ